jgi:hypothetical protein
MNKFIAVLLTAGFLMPAVTLAYTDCRDTDKGCTTDQLLTLSQSTVLTQQDKVNVLQLLVQQLSSLLTQLLDQKGRMQEDNHNSPSPNACFVPINDLYIGRTDAQTNGEVSKLQLWLHTAGYFSDAMTTGYYGEKTAAAVVLWQKAHGMDFVTTKSGVGKMTREKIAEECQSVSVGKCGFSVSSPQANSSVTFPLTIKGVVDNSKAQQLGCSWSMFEGAAGGAQLYYNYQNQGWKTLNTPRAITVSSWMTTTTPFEFTMPFDNSSIGLPSGTPLKIIFSEDNASGLPPVDSYELPLILK